MPAPDPTTLPPLVRATYLAMCGSAPAAPMDPGARGLLAAGLPPDLHALVHAWAHHPRSTLGWEVLFDRWDLRFALAPMTPEAVRDGIRAVTGGTGRTELPGEPLLRLGLDAGGTEYFVGVTAGASSVVGPERTEDDGTLEAFLATLWERAELAPEPALAPFVDPDMFAPLEPSAPSGPRGRVSACSSARSARGRAGRRRGTGAPGA